MCSLASNDFGSGLNDFTDLKVKTYSGKPRAESEAVFTLPLEVYDSRFSAQTLRVNEIGSPRSSYFFGCDDLQEPNVSWVVGLSTTYILYGFKPLLEIEVLFRERESLKPLAEALTLFGVESVYAHIVKASSAELYHWIDPILSETMSSYREGKLKHDSPDFWLHQLVEGYDEHGWALDANILNVYLLNLCCLKPSMALRLENNQMFMPLRGMCLEALTQLQSLVEFDAEFWLHGRQYQDETHDDEVSEYSKEQLCFDGCKPSISMFPKQSRNEMALNLFGASDYCFTEVPSGGMNRHEVFDGQILLVTEGELWINGKIRVREREAVIFSESECLHIHGVRNSLYLVALVG